MRICSPQLGISPKSILGGEVFDREILLGLAKKGIQVEIILPKGLPHDKKIKNWQITYLPIQHIPAIFFNVIITPYLFVIYKRRPFDLIRLHSPMYIGFGAILFKFFHPKVKIAATITPQITVCQVRTISPLLATHLSIRPPINISTKIPDNINVKTNQAIKTRPT